MLSNSAGSHNTATVSRAFANYTGERADAATKDLGATQPAEAASSAGARRALSTDARSPRARLKAAACVRCVLQPEAGGCVRCMPIEAILPASVARGHDCLGAARAVPALLPAHPFALGCGS